MSKNTGAGPGSTPGQGEYPVPAETVRAELLVRRSRFLATVGRAGSREDAEAFLRRVREEMPTATHHAYAFVAGEPDRTTDVGMSDDGEPSGTAGRPMMALLQHRGIGEVVAVVTRFYGGIKLGTGGLVRAYSGSLQKALSELPLERRIPLVRAELRIPFAEESRVRRALEELGLPPAGVRYEAEVVLELVLPAARLEELGLRLDEETRGKGRLEARPVE